MGGRTSRSSWTWLRPTAGEGSEVDVRYEQVTKQFGTVIALQALTLNVADGAFLALLGPSGCGKTTALRILAGLERPTGGRVYIGPRAVTWLEPRDRDIAM